MTTANLPETTLQFGTGKFLRCFADLFIHQLNQTGRPVGRIVAVQSTGSERAARLNRQGGRFHVAVRGLRGGRRVDHVHEVTSVSRALAAGDDWPGVLDFARSESLRTVISNTTEAGYALDDRDRPGDCPPRSFPAKLLAVLAARFEAGLSGLTILPCELLESNGRRLRHLVLDQAARWDVSAELAGWIESECWWQDTLVDRIVSAAADDDPLLAGDPLSAVAEPFASWLIEGKPRIGPLADHPAVECVDRLGPYHLRKVRILNGAHTALVAKALPLGFATVRQAVLDPGIAGWLDGLLFEEIVPTLEGRTARPEAFARDVLERFRNPFLAHRLADIALHHEIKLKTRLLPTRREFEERFGRVPPRLEEILDSPSGREPGEEC